MDDKEQQNNKPAKGYGKRPVWQWVLIYLVLAVVVYGLIYVLFIGNGSDGNTGDNGGGFSY
jgi:hypothetical protein